MTRISQVFSQRDVLCKKFNGKYQFIMPKSYQKKTLIEAKASRI